MVLIDRMQQTAMVHEDVLQLFDIDTRGVFLGPPDHRRDRDLDEETWQDEWGVTRIKPPGSYWYDLKSSPLAGEISVSDIVNYRWPDPHDPGRTRGLAERVAQLKRTNYAVVLNLTSGFFTWSQILRGFEDWYVDVLLSPHVIGALMDAILEVQMAIIADALNLVGDQVDIVYTADDLGGQRGPLISPELYRRLCKPRHLRLLDSIRSRTSAPLLLHCCGSVYDLLPDLIDLGVNVLNPVQVGADKMDTARLKREFGDRIAFWGGIDSQWVLPYGTVGELEQEVKRRIADLAPGGGYVLSAVHNVQAEVPPDRICHMYAVAKEFGRYPLGLPGAQ